MDRRRTAAATALAVTGLLVVLATFLPWVHNGARSRSSYRLLGTVDRLGIAGDGPAGTAITLWPVVPLLVTSAVVLGWWRCARLAVVMAVLSTAYVVGVAAVLIAARGVAEVDLGVGVWVGAATALAFSAAAVAVLVTAANDLDR
jgi:hypothetical protein